MLCDYPLRPDRIGGMDRFFWAMDKRMQAEGWSATWILPYTPDQRHYHSRGFNIVTFPKDTFLSSAVKHINCQNRVDLLVSHFVPCTTKYSLFLHKKYVRRYMAVYHMSPGRQRNFAKKIYSRTKGFIAYFFVNRVIAVSGFVRESILREYGYFWKEKISVIYNGVDPKIFFHNADEPRNIKNTLHIVSVAHLIKEKGIQDLLEALSRVREMMPDFSLSIAGDGPYGPALKLKTQELHLEKQVNFLGSLSYTDELLRSADISVTPSLCKEAFPFSVLEALFSGVPIIASRAGGVPEQVGQDAALLYKPGDIKALSEKLLALANDPDLRSKMRLACIERAKQFTLSAMVERHIEYMKKFIQ